MNWETFAHGELFDLQQILGRMNSEKYETMLHNCLI